MINEEIQLMIVGQIVVLVHTTGLYYTKNNYRILLNLKTLNLYVQIN